MERKRRQGYNIRQSTVFLQEPVVEIQVIITYHKFNINIRKLFLDVWCIFFILAAWSTNILWIVSESSFSALLSATA